MRIEMVGLLITLLLGIFILIGSLIAFLIKKRQKVIDFSLGLAFSVIVMLSILDLIPEIIENLRLSYIWVFIIGVILGYGILKSLDNFIPDHEDNKMNNKELKDNLAHIGVISSIALMIHNIIEGIAIYSTTVSDVSTGLLLSVGVGFHNLPLGMVIATTFYQANQSKKKTILFTSLLSLSTLCGGVIMFLLNTKTLNPIVLGLFLSVTLGMLIFISLSELYPRMKEIKDKETKNMGLLVGFILLLISWLISQ
ncbi:MAG: hypothetical protein E7160_04740 [Firmicutes bacterium]|nr:hypothetical protein [Bacillota bacterium]